MAKFRSPKFDVFLFSPFFFPEQISTGKYNTFLAKAMVEAGCKVGVCSSHPIYPDWIPKFSAASFPGMEVFRGGRWVRFPKNAILRRALLECWYAAFALFVSLRYRRQISIALVIFPPNLFQSLLNFVLPRNIRRVGIVHDIQAGLGCKHEGKRSFLEKMIICIEGRALRSCDKLIFLSTRMLEYAGSLYDLPKEKCQVHHPFVTVPHGVGEHSMNLASMFIPGRVHVVYSGALGEKQDPQSLIRFFQALCTHRDDVQCHIFSCGHLFNHLRSQPLVTGGNHIAFHDLVDEDDLPELYSRSTVQVLPQREGSSDFAFPSKLPNLLAVGVPVFAITDPSSEVSGILDDYEMGAVVHSWDAEKILPAFERFLEDNSKKEKQAASRQIMEKFDMNRLVEYILRDHLPCNTI